MPLTGALRKGVESERRPEEALPSSDARAHVCFVAPYCWPVLSRDPGIQIVGGAEVQQTILARLFRRSGYRVSMITLDHGQPSPAQVDGITVRKTFRPESGLPVLRFVHPRLTSTWRAMQEADADIYYHRSSSMLAAIVAEFCRRNGARSIYAGASDMDFVPGKEQITLSRDRWLYQHGVRTVDHIVVQNRHQLETCRANYGRAATLIPSCYELPDGSDGAIPLEKRDVVLWCGTVHTYKRPEIFLEIARRLPQHRFVMIGGAGVDETLSVPYFDKVMAEARALPNVEATGFLPLHKVEPWFDRARVLINSSDYEGMPNTFMQAWARGVPTVATVDVGARVNGKSIYRTFADVADGAQEVDSLMTDAGYWRQRSAAVGGYFERTHSSAEVLRRYSEVFDALMAKRAAA